MLILLLEQKFQETKVPGNGGSRERKFPGMKVLGYDSSMIILILMQAFP